MKTNKKVVVFLQQNHTKNNFLNFCCACVFALTHYFLGPHRVLIHIYYMKELSDEGEGHTRGDYNFS